MLFAPGNHPRRVEKAFTLGADAVILDLEDACPVPEKAASRAAVVGALQRPRDCLGYVRINALTTEYRSEEHTSELQSLMRISYAVFCLQYKNSTYYISTIHSTQPHY